MKSQESELTSQIQQKDPLACEQVVRKHTAHLYKACLGLGFKDFEAEDITQQVWTTFFEKINEFEQRSTIRTFLFGILYNKASEMRRQNKRAEPTENIEEIIDSHFDQRDHWIASHSPIDPERFLQSAQTLSILAKCLEYLPFVQKTAFVLKEVDEEVTENICNILQVTASHLGVLLFRARNQLRECVEKKSS